MGLTWQEDCTRHRRVASHSLAAALEDDLGLPRERFGSLEPGQSRVTAELETVACRRGKKTAVVSKRECSKRELGEVVHQNLVHGEALVKGLASYAFAADVAEAPEWVNFAVDRQRSRTWTLGWETGEDSGHMEVEEVLHQLLENWHSDWGSSWRVNRAVVPCNFDVNSAAVKKMLALAARNCIDRKDFEVLASNPWLVDMEELLLQSFPNYHC